MRKIERNDMQELRAVLNQLPILLLLSVQFLFSQSKACSCVGQDTFMKSISEFTAEVEIVAVDSTTMLIGSNSFRVPVTKLLIRDVLRGEANGDTLYLMIDGELGCFHDIPYRQIGQRYILTGSFRKKQLIAGNEAFTKSIFYLDDCLEGTVILRDGKAIGYVQKNKFSRITKRQRFLSHFSKRLASAYYNKRVKQDEPEKLMQTMSERRFHRKFSRAEKKIPLYIPFDY
jgi:hypothetical protein